MKYELEISDLSSAEAFIRWCVREIGFGYHPDTRGADYENRDGTPSFTPEEAKTLDNLHEKAFRLLVDPYAVALDEVKRSGAAIR